MTSDFSTWVALFDAWGSVSIEGGICSDSDALIRFRIQGSILDSSEGTFGMERFRDIAIHSDLQEVFLVSHHGASSRLWKQSFRRSVLRNRTRYTIVEVLETWMSDVPREALQ